MYLIPSIVLERVTNMETLLFIVIIAELSFTTGVLLTKSKTGKYYEVIIVTYINSQHSLDPGGEREMFYLTTHSTHFIYGYMVKDHSDSEKGNPLPPHRLLLSIIGINIGKCFVSDIMNVVKKYNLLDVIYSYLQHGTFMDKLLWCGSVKNTLTEFENVSHTSKLHRVPELIRYCDIHPNISVHILWKIAYVHPNFKIM